MNTTDTIQVSAILERTEGWLSLADACRNRSDHASEEINAIEASRAFDEVADLQTDDPSMMRRKLGINLRLMRFYHSRYELRQVAVYTSRCATLSNAIRRCFLYDATWQEYAAKLLLEEWKRCLCIGNFKAARLAALEASDAIDALQNIDEQRANKYRTTVNSCLMINRFPRPFLYALWLDGQIQFAIAKALLRWRILKPK